MNIEESFTQDAIEAADTNVGGEEEVELRAVLLQICQDNELELTPDEMNLMVLCFVAGRTYQAPMGERVNISMSQEGLATYVEFLSQQVGLLTRRAHE